MLARNSKILNENLSVIEFTVQEFLDSGVCILIRNWDIKPPTKNTMGKLVSANRMVTLTRAVAKEYKRPFILLDITKRTENDGRGRQPMWRAILAIPKIQKLDQVVAGLILLSENVDSAVSDVQYDLHKYKQPRMQLRGTKRYFYFGEQHKPILDAWLERCKSDPVFKVCLGIGAI